jgi:hypothetical protein
MTENNHLINLSEEVIDEWRSEYSQYITLGDNGSYTMFMAKKAAQWGADQELEACCEWFQEFYKTESWVKHDLKHFRAARRPKPPTLKEQALEAVIRLGKKYPSYEGADIETIRRALEALPND